MRVVITAPTGFVPDGVLFHFRQNGEDMGTVRQRINLFRVRNITEYVDTLMARDRAVSSAAAAAVSERRAGVSETACRSVSKCCVDA